MRLAQYKRFAVLVLAGLLLTVSLGFGARDETQTTRMFLDGIKHYENGDFKAAKNAFLALTQEGIVNGRLFYNLGNAYLKNDEIGPAILWYEKALKLMPNDPDLKFNLDHARSFVKDETETTVSPIFKILFFWKYLLGGEAVKWAAIVFNALFWLFLATNAFRRLPFYWLRHVFLVLALVFTLTAFYNIYAARFHRQAVILPEKVSIRSGLTKDATELFVLHAGTKVRVEKEKDGWLRIFFSDGKIGWVNQSQIGII